MSKKNENNTITMTEEQLERTIKSAVKNALRELKNEEELPGNEVDERKAAPASFSLLELMATSILSIAIIFSFLIIFAGFKMLLDSGFNLVILVMCLAFAMIGIISILAIRELQKTKKIEVLSTIFSAIMALSTLLVAIISAYFAYKAL